MSFVTKHLGLAAHASACRCPCVVRVAANTGAHWHDAIRADVWVGKCARTPVFPSISVSLSLSLSLSLYLSLSRSLSLSFCLSLSFSCEQTHRATTLSHAHSQRRSVAQTVGE